MLALETVGRDVKDGLSLPRKRLPSKYFYDARGSALFERICLQPEYYVTRAELALLAESAGAVARACPFDELVELGSGSTRKARLLLGARAARRYVPVDVSRGALEEARALEGVEVVPVEGDFLGELVLPRRGGRRLVAFLGSTLGNLDDGEATGLLLRVSRLLGPRDRLLLGVDLVKDRSVLERAYNDAAGVTAEFNRNILRAVSRRLDGDARPELFEHVAFWNERRSAIEMHLRARESHSVRFAAIDFHVWFSRGETIHTEDSRKWTRGSLAALLARAGFELAEWFASGGPGAEPWFALALARPA